MSFDWKTMRIWGAKVGRGYHKQFCTARHQLSISQKERGDAKD